MKAKLWGTSIQRFLKCTQFCRAVSFCFDNFACDGGFDDKPASLRYTVSTNPCVAMSRRRRWKATGEACQRPACLID